MLIVKKKYKIIITGGGTGGHVFPAIAIANALKRRNNQMNILFVGASDRMEMEKVPAAGYPIKGLWISGLQRGLAMKNLLFPFKVLASLIKSNSIINKFKPDVVVGTGGYSSGPVVYVASRKGLPTLLQEQNSYAGITNKLLSKRADKICVAYDNMQRFFPKEKIVLTGNPVGQDILSVPSTRNREYKRMQAIKYFALSSDLPAERIRQAGKKTVLIIGGSLGAKTINESITEHIEGLNNSGHQFIWQTGKPFYKRAVDATKDSRNIKVYDFISRMDLAYAAADVVVSRAGAIAISELCVVNKPVILVPSPNVAEDHQTKNALALIAKDAALMVSDAEAKELLVKTMLELIEDTKRQEQLSQNIARLAKPYAAENIANEVMKLVSS